MRRIAPLLIASLLTMAWATFTFAAPPRAVPFGDGVTPSIALHAAAPMRMAAPSSTMATYTDPLSAALAVGNRLANLQADVTEDNAGNGGVDTDAEDGGWDFDITGDTQHPAGKSYENLYGPVVRGLAEMAIFTGSARLGTAVSDVFAGISKPGTGLLGSYYYRIFDADIAAAYVRWGAFTGNPALKDTIRARHDQELSVRGGAGGRARTIRNGRGAGLAGLWPWDVHMMSNDSKVLAAAFPGSAAQYEAEVDSVSQVVMDDRNLLLGPTGWNPASVAQNYHTEGIAAALRIFDGSLRTDDDALALVMRDSLLSSQLADGSWGLWYGGVCYGQGAQSTSYAVLALMEYAQRHGDAVARAAAFRGQAFLLNLIGPGGVIDDGGGEYSEGAGEVMQAVLAGDPVAAGPAAGCITPANPCITVPVTFNRSWDNTPVRGYSVTLTLSPNLSLCGSQIVEGGYLSAVGGTHFEVVDNGGGSYTVDCAIMGGVTGATGNGTLFTLNLASAATGTGTVTIQSVSMRDLTNGPVSGIPGTPLSIVLDNTAPAAVSGLTATQLLAGNDGDGTTKINLSWAAAEAGATVHVYRKGFGSYPEYDDAGGAAPSLPGGYPPAGWTLAASLTGTTAFADEPATRDVWYYVAYVQDPCGNVSGVSTMTGGTLDYHLGDVSNGLTAGVGNNQVLTADVSLLGANYGITLAFNDPVNYLDVGPTLNGYVNVRPVTDNKVNFEDLMMFAINYGAVSAPQAAVRPAASKGNTLALRVPTLPLAGGTFAVGVDLASAAVQGVSVRIAWNAAVVEPIGVEAGSLLQAQRMPSAVLSAAPGNVDVALLGTGQAITGSGEVARVLFRVKGSGDPGITLASAVARGVDNQDIPLGTTGIGQPPAAFVTGLGAVYPNPIRNGATVEMSLRAESDVSLAVYDLLGRRVSTLVRGTQPAGTRLVSWNGRTAGGARLSPGMYVIRFTAGDVTESRRVLLVP